MALTVGALVQSVLSPASLLRIAESRPVIGRLVGGDCCKDIVVHDVMGDGLIGDAVVEN